MEMMATKASKIGIVAAAALLIVSSPVALSVLHGYKCVNYAYSEDPCYATDPLPQPCSKTEYSDTCGTCQHTGHYADECQSNDPTERGGTAPPAEKTFTPGECDDNFDCQYDEEAAVVSLVPCTC